MNYVGLERAISFAGNLTRLAKAIGKRQSTVWHWKQTGVVPAEHCAAIETVTNGTVTKADLRPDIFGSRLNANRPAENRSKAV